MGNNEESAHDPMPIELPDLNIPPKWLETLGHFLSKSSERLERNMTITSEILNELYDQIENEAETATLIISYLQSRHKWDIELLAVKDEVEDMLFARDHIFDEHIWEKVINTTAISDLHHEVYKLSQEFIGYAIDEVLDEEEANGVDPYDMPDDVF